LPCWAISTNAAKKPHEIMDQTRPAHSGRVLTQKSPMTTPLPSDGYHHPKLIHPVPADDYFYCRVSAFRHYAAGYVEELLDRLALLTDTDVNFCASERASPMTHFSMETPKPPSYWDWIMDCQDYHDIDLLLDATGNLDASV